MRLQFLLLQLSRRTQVLHTRTFDLAIEFERGLIVVLNADRDPRSMPKSRQSLAVKINGALTGTTPTRLRYR